MEVMPNFFKHHDFLKEHEEEQQIVQHVLDWLLDDQHMEFERMGWYSTNTSCDHEDLETQGLFHIVEECDICNEYGQINLDKQKMMPDPRTRERLIADFFDINLKGYHDETEVAYKLLLWHRKQGGADDDEAQIKEAEPTSSPA